MWTVSRMIKTLVILKLNGLHYPGMTSDNVFVAVGEHTIFLPGYWWDLKEGDEDYSEEMTQVRSLAQNSFSGGAYPEVLEWCTEGPEKDPFDALSRWDDVVDESVIVRKFVPLVVSDRVWEE
jgi:hypothetical protein